MRRFFSSESVTEGHPDKVADQISDAILDAIIEKDPESRVAVETIVTRGLAFVSGEISTREYIELPKVIRETIWNIGYTRAKFGFDGETCGVLSSIAEQSEDIALGVNQSLEAKEGEKAEDQLDQLGAGDQGMMFGYATNETPEMMPLPILLAHKLTMQLAKTRKDGTLPFLRPDGKSQVTIEYDEHWKPRCVDTVLIAAQHEDVSYSEIRDGIIEKVIMPVIPETLRADHMKILINPTGRFVIGGPQGDTGLTGRKIIVDTYGGWVPHGGGAFSGKDPTKVDRSAHYMARYVAKNIVAAGLADKVLIQLAYAIGKANPVSIMIDTYGTSKIDETRLNAIVREVFDFRPGRIIKKLDLRKPIYLKTAAYGHFGRTDVDFTWERTDMATTLKSQAGL
ncbi:MAG TPA: methionine adenosyltransferase [Thermotogota bacterium]|nr:methionine adenosyltransferase [Thermotogaceae bacterium]HNT94922.1 methionine adenosyltransferase [Thermotogota bacterium]HPB86653.1 methionine adenosyltransferase [Thermotogota bacterium]HPH10210.1 methionine adenosyltransferase [Thermotogota bacterium]HPM21731.1 methionine adenosyltransferase [Thermotogota bacterium]